MILSSFGFLCSRLEHFLNRELCIINGLPYQHSFDHHYRGVYLQSGLQAKSDQIPPSSTDCDWWADNYFISVDNFLN